MAGRAARSGCGGFLRDHSFQQSLPLAPELLSIFWLLQEHPSSLETRASPKPALSNPSPFACVSALPTSPLLVPVPLTGLQANGHDLLLLRALSLLVHQHGLQSFVFGRASLQAGRGEQQFTGAPELRSLKSCYSSAHSRPAPRTGSNEECGGVSTAPTSLGQARDCWTLGFTASADPREDGYRCLGSKSSMRMAAEPLKMWKRGSLPALRNILAQIPSSVQCC